MLLYKGDLRINCQFGWLPDWKQEACLKIKKQKVRKNLSNFSILFLFDKKERALQNYDSIHRSKIKLSSAKENILENALRNTFV